MPSHYLHLVVQPEQRVNSLLRLLNASVVRAENGEAELHAVASREFSQGAGLVGGGILATLADEAMAHAVLSTLASAQSTVTLDMNIRYLRAMKPDESGTLKAIASLIKTGRRTVVARAEVMDMQRDNALLAVADATFLITAS